MLTAAQKNMMAELSNSSYRATDHWFRAWHRDGSSTQFQLVLRPGWSGQDHLFDRTLAELEVRLASELAPKTLSTLRISGRNGRGEICNVTRFAAPESVADDYEPSCPAEAAGLWPIVEARNKMRLWQLQNLAICTRAKLANGFPGLFNVNDMRRHAWPDAPWEFYAPGGHRHFATREMAEQQAAILRSETESQCAARITELDQEIAAESAAVDSRLAEIRAAWGL